VGVVLNLAEHRARRAARERVARAQTMSRHPTAAVSHSEALWRVGQGVVAHRITSLSSNRTDCGILLGAKPLTPVSSYTRRCSRCG
jgi:hypothetical protein